MAPLVDRAAQQGDRAALGILHRAAQELAQLASAVRAQLWSTGDAVELAYAGGVFESSILRERFRLLVEMEEGSALAPPLHPPHMGALLEAYRAAGVNVEWRLTR
jgi:N-acetylglucosamine kinase-like BadF-type ATPase